MIKSAAEALKKVGPSFKIEPFASIIQPIIKEVLAEHKKDQYRKGAILTPLIRACCGKRSRLCHYW